MAPQCLPGRKKPWWMTKGRTVLLKKDKSKANEGSNWRPITCPPFSCKLLTIIIANETYGFKRTKRYYQKSRKDTEEKLRVLETSYT